MNNISKINDLVKLQDIMVDYNKLTNTEAATHLVHYFIPGIYVREIWLPAGTLCVSKTHKRDLICILSKGIFRIVSDEFTETIEAPYTFISKKGVKRAVFAFTDVVFTTIHRTDETDLTKIEDDIAQDETYLGEIT